MLRKVMEEFLRWFHLFYFSVMNISTSSQLCFPVHCSNFTPARSDNPSPISYFPYFDEQYLAVAASLNGGNVLTHFVKMLQQWFSEFGEYMLTCSCFVC